ncbi:unnamed protein product [Boreogadus saida]
MWRVRLRRMWEEWEGGRGKARCPSPSIRGLGFGGSGPSDGAPPDGSPSSDSDAYQRELPSGRRVTVVTAGPTGDKEWRSEFCRWIRGCRGCECPGVGRHCLLEAELSCVKDLLRREIYPIIIFIKICERNVKRLRKLPLRLESEEDFVRMCRVREKELEGVACLYSTVEPDTWAGPDDLVRVVKERIQEEQRKVVWVEQDLL